jgi:hypothetical protein
MPCGRGDLIRGNEESFLPRLTLAHCHRIGPCWRSK